MATVTAAVKKDEDDTKADIVKVIKSSFEGKPKGEDDTKADVVDEDDTKDDVVKIIKSSFEGKPVEARKAFDEAMMSKISAALALRTEEIKADIYDEDKDEEDLDEDKDEVDEDEDKDEVDEDKDEEDLDEDKDEVDEDEDKDEVDEELSDKQKELDADGDGKIGADDLAKLRKEPIEENMNKVYSVEIDHMGGNDPKAKKLGVTLKKTGKSSGPAGMQGMAPHKVTGKKKDLQKYLTYFYDAEDEAREYHPEVYEESMNPVNEVSDKTLDSYGRAALNDVQKRRSDRPAGQGDESDPKIAQRLRGMEAQARKQQKD